MPTFTALSRVSCSSSPEHITSWHEAEISLAGGQKEFKGAERGQKASSTHDKKMQMHETEQRGTWSAAVSAHCEPRGRGRLSRLCSCRTQWGMEEGQQESRGKSGLKTSPAIPSCLNPFTSRELSLKEMQPTHSISFGISERLEMIEKASLINFEKLEKRFMISGAGQSHWNILLHHSMESIHLFTHHSITSMLHTHTSLRAQRYSSWLKRFLF